MIKRKFYLIEILVFVMIAGMHLLTLRAGQDWGGDFSVYIQHAKNLVEGKGYYETSYLYDSSPFADPCSYPPGFPLLLAPVYALWGLNFTAMKIEMIVLFLIFLLLFRMLCHDEFPPLLAILMVGLLGVNPFFLEFKNRILSDIPFVVFMYAGACSVYYASYVQQHHLHRHQDMWAGATGILFFLASNTRSVGILLLPALLLQEIFIERRISRFTLGVSCVFFGLVGMKIFFSPGNFSYVTQLHLPAPQLSSTVFHYIRALSLLWENGVSKSFRWLFFGISSILAFSGYLISLKEHRSFLDVFFPLYLVVIVIWPFQQGTRLLIPVIPLYVRYIFLCVQKNQYLRKYQLRPAGLITLTGAIMFTYLCQYSYLERGPFPTGVHTQESQELFTYVQEYINYDAIIIFWKPRILALFTSRKAIACPPLAQDEDVWRFIRDIQATHVILGPFPPTFLQTFLARYPSEFRQIYYNADFGVYLINTSP